MNVKTHASKGFTLIEMLVAVGVLSVLGLAFASMMAESAAQAAYIEDKFSSQQFHSELRGLLADEEACNKNFLNQVIPAPGKSKTIEIKDSTGGIRFSASKPKNKTYDRLDIKEITLKNIDATAAKKGGRVAVEVALNRQRKGGGPTQLKEISEILNVSIVGANPTPFKVTSCSAPGGGGSQPLIAQGSLGPSGNISTEDVYLPFAEVTFERRGKPAIIMASAEVGGGYSDLWYNIKVTKQMNGGTEKGIYSWNNGTGKKGAATNSSAAFIDTGKETGTVTYKVWVMKRSKANHSPNGGSYIQLNNSRIQVMQN